MTTRPDQCVLGDDIASSVIGMADVVIADLSEIRLRGKAAA